MRLEIACIRTSFNLEKLFDPNKMWSKIAHAGSCPQNRLLIQVVALKTRLLKNFDRPQNRLRLASTAFFMAK